MKLPTTAITEFTPLIHAISKRKSFISRKVIASGTDILDAYHGEMKYTMHPNAQQAVRQLTDKILNQTAVFKEEDGRMYSKSQPEILRKLAAQKLFPQFTQAGLLLDESDIIVSPYSSLGMLEAALMTIAKPDGILLCPFGFYKSNALHIEKFGLQLRYFETSLENDARITPLALKAAIQKHKDQLCGVLFTMPGNPLVADYTKEELVAIGRVLVEAKVKVIIDSVFTGIHIHHHPLAAAEVVENGQTHLLHNQTLTVAGLSKGHHACGPYKIGAATSGDKQWLAEIKSKLVISFQRETTALAKAVIENTPCSYLLENEQEMQLNQQMVKKHFKTINEQLGEDVLNYFGTTQYGPFVLLKVRQDILEMAGINDGWQLADMLLASVGLDTVAGPRMGILQPCVRININAPRMNGKKNPELLSELFIRLKQFIAAVLHNGLTYQKALEQIKVPTKISVQKQRILRINRFRKISKNANSLI